MNSGADPETKSAITSFLMDDALHDGEKELSNDFEEFPVEDWPEPGSKQGECDYSLWETEWDLDTGSGPNAFKSPEQQLFCEQLRLEIAKMNKQ